MTATPQPLTTTARPRITRREPDLRTHDAPPVRSPSDASPGLHRLDDLVRGFAQWYLEFEVGRRHVEQVERVLAPALVARLHARRSRLRRRARRDRRPLVGPTPGDVVNVRTQRVNGHAVEALAVVRRGARATALAMRLERHRGRWRIVELAGPEHGERPVRAASIPDPAVPREPLL